MDSGRYIVIFGKAHRYEDPDVELRFFIPDAEDVSLLVVSDYSNREVTRVEIPLEELAALANEIRKSL